MDTLNITSLLAGLSPQMMTSLNAGQTTGNQAPVDGSFMDLLQSVVAQLGNPAEPMASVAAPAQAPPWLETLLTLLGPNGSLPAQTPDPTGEASPTATTAQLTSLTEVMAAIQSILPESSLDKQLIGSELSVAAGPQVQMGKQETDTDDQLSLGMTLAAVMGIIPTGLTATQQAAAPADVTASTTQTTLPATVQGTVVPVQTNGVPLQVAPAGQALPAAEAAELPVADLAAQEAPAAETTTPAATAQSAEPTATDFNQLLNATQTQETSRPAPAEALAQAADASTTQSAEAQTTVNLKMEGSTSTSGNTPAAAATIAQAADATTVRSTAETDTHAHQQNQNAATNGESAISTASLAEPARTTQPVFAVNDAQSVEAKSALPNIPALHQLTDSIKLLNENGQTSVQLKLHPESLGQVMVQLHVADGQVAVHMLAETSQAQSLIQNHLSQLKAAFSIQGLNADTLNVNVGSDASAFNAPSQQQQQQTWSNEANRPYFTPAANTTSSPINAPASRSTGSLSQIDYQV